MLSHKDLAIKHPGRFQKRLNRLQKSQYSRGMLAGAIASLRPRDVCVDCGAHIGKISDRFLARGAQVYAFEPDPYCISKLHLLFDENPHFNLHEAALGTAPGNAELIRRDDFANDPLKVSESSSVTPKALGDYTSSGIKVPVIDCRDALADIITRHGTIAILKMDIEGAELEILEQLVETDIFDKIRVTIVETHERHLPGSWPRFKHLRDLAHKHPDWGLNLDWV